jgi:hypothetical protein
MNTFNLRKEKHNQYISYLYKLKIILIHQKNFFSMKFDVKSTFAIFSLYFNKILLFLEEKKRWYTITIVIEEKNSTSNSMSALIKSAIPWTMLAGQMLPRQLLPSDICSPGPYQAQIKNETHSLSCPHPHLHPHPYLHPHPHSDLRLHPQLFGEQVLLGSKCRWGASARGAPFVLPNRPLPWRIKLME